MDTPVLTKCFAVLMLLFFASSAHAGYKPGPGWPEVSTPFYRASSLTQALLRFSEWQQQNLVIRGYRDTGSMHPVLEGGREVMAMERCAKDTPLEPGQMVEFNRGDLPAVLHYIADVSHDGEYLYLSGVNSRYSDGWFHRSAVAYVVREIIVTPDLQPLSASRQMAVVSPQKSESAPKPGTAPKQAKKR
jgi:hypothetical protein